MENNYYTQVQGQQPSVPPPPSPPPPPPQPDPVQVKAYEKYQAKKELKKAIGASHEILASAQTIFPFVLFPDTITIDRGKLTISHRSFFRVAEVISIRIEDILNVTANVGPFFGSLQITTRFFGTGSESADKSYRINWLARDDALKIKRIAHGYITALQKEVDTSALSPDELANLFMELGADSPDER